VLACAARGAVKQLCSLSELQQLSKLQQHMWQRASTCCLANTGSAHLLRGWRWGRWWGRCTPAARSCIWCPWSRVSVRLVALPAKQHRLLLRPAAWEEWQSVLQCCLRLRLAGGAAQCLYRIRALGFIHELWVMKQANFAELVSCSSKLCVKRQGVYWSACKTRD